jgi:hypothetical protein
VLADAPILTQYVFFLTMNVVATIAQHGIIRFLVKIFLRIRPSGSRPTTGDYADDNKTIKPGHASPSAISTALLVSSCTKLFPILLVIWPTAETHSSSEAANSLGGPFASLSSYIGWAVLLNNIEALLILLNCGYIVASGLAFAGMSVRWLVESWALNLIGLNCPGSRELEILSDVLAFFRRWIPL